MWWCMSMSNHNHYPGIYGWLWVIWDLVPSIWLVLRGWNILNLIHFRRCNSHNQPLRLLIIVDLQFISLVYLKCIFHIWLFIFTDSRIISVANNYHLSLSHNIHNLMDDAIQNVCYVQISYLIFISLFIYACVQFLLYFVICLFTPK